MESRQQDGEGALAPATRRTLGTIFLTLFIDLVGFSIIFPLFPAMLEFYIQEGAGGLMGAMLHAVEGLRTLIGGAGHVGDEVLFGGILGSLYSLLQFLCAPILGALSDRFGRRPILLVSITGIAISYLLWVVAGHFWVLVLARFLGGVMSANIATASAAVADITDHKTRSKGMAIIGIAFGLGFILGPVIGGLTALVDLTAVFPASVAYGINPFSAPALVALVLAVINLAYVYFRFPETLPPGGSERPLRTANPLLLFGGAAAPGVHRTNIAYFVFITAFSGMEFSLTFLAAERLGYGPAGIGMLLLYVGLILVMVQGGYVRRKGDVLGPKRVALQGVACAIPGMAIIGFASSLPVLLVGLMFMAVGSGQVVPCMTALVSLYAPAEEQGRMLGIFRSLGALGRAIGPLIAAMVYWRLGSGMAYYACAIVLAAPLIMVQFLPAPREAPSHA